MHNPVDPAHERERERTTTQPDQTASTWAVEAFDIGLWELDVATYALELSPRAGMLLGIAPGHSTCDALMAALHPHDRAMIPPAIKRASDPAASGHVRLDIRVVDSTGRITWIDCRAHTEYACVGHERRAVRLRGAMLDITERKRIEERSRTSEEHLRIATEAALYYSWQIDLATGTYRSSLNIHQILGFILPPALADVWTMIHEEDRPAFQATLTTAVTNLASFTVEFRLIHPHTGANVWVSSSGTALAETDDLPPRVVGVTQNITERRKAEWALRQSEERYRTLFTSITEGFTIIEKLPTPLGAPSNYLFVEANTRLEQFIGVGSIAGKTVRDVFPLASPFWFDTFDQVLITGASLRLNDGYPLNGWTLEINAFRVEDQTNNRIGVLVVDITERDNAQRIREQAWAATEEARQTAVAAIATRDTFMRIASHELRTPLTSLLGYARLLETGTLHQPDMTPQIAQLIIRQTQRLDRLVGQMLDTSRLERGQFAIDPVIIDLTKLVQEVVEEFRQTLPRTQRHRLVVHMLHRPLLIMADAERMSQVFQNLLTNAVKYSAFGSPLGVHVYEIDADAVVEVIDHGIGIAPDAQGHIFEAYYRADDAGLLASGFGLGLHIAQEIVVRHGGRIEIESTVGEGSTFRVFIPRLLPSTET